MSLGRAVPSQPFDRVSYWAERNPGKALIDDGINRVGYAEAVRLARQIAYQLRSRGATAGDRLTLDVPPGMAALCTLAGFHEALVVVTAPARKRSAATNEWLLTTTDTHDEFTIVMTRRFLEELGDPPPDFAPRRYSSNDATVGVVFSSGTTGLPKAVPLTLAMAHHRGVAANALVIPGEEFLCTLGQSSSSGFHTFYGAITTGLTYLIPGDANHNLSLIRRYEVAAVKASPVQISELCDAIVRSGESVASLRTLYSAGATMPPGVRRKVSRVTSAKIVNLYGSTEVGRAAERALNDDDIEWVGNVVPGTDLEIVDDDDRPLPPGRIGNVRYRRPYQAAGYDDDDSESSKAFRGGWFYPGDRGSLSPSNELRLAGRTSDFVNAGGLKVHPSESETEALTTGLVDEAAGFEFSDTDGLTWLGLAVVGGGPHDLRTLNEHLQRTLSSRAPRAIFRLQELPVSPSGKVRREELRRLYENAIRRKPPYSP